MGSIPYERPRLADAKEKDYKPQDQQVKLASSTFDPQTLHVVASG
jgi:hypothetical protein